VSLHQFLGALLEFPGFLLGSLDPVSSFLENAQKGLEDHAAQGNHEDQHDGQLKNNREVELDHLKISPDQMPNFQAQISNRFEI
jgi:hypothetical protein